VPRNLFRESGVSCFVEAPVNLLESILFSPLPSLLLNLFRLFPVGHFYLSLKYDGKIVELLMQYDNTTLAVMIKAEDDYLLATDPAITQ
jgi:hypothetical protein